MTEKHQIFSMIHSLYLKIRDIESTFAVGYSNEDMRIRIEYFHDAIRALTSGENQERLQATILASDLKNLRAIQFMPLRKSQIRKNLSPKTDIIVADDDNSLKQLHNSKRKLTEYYQKYAVFFAALFADLVDEECEMKTRDEKNKLLNMMQLQEMFEAEKTNTQMIDDLIIDIDNNELQEIYQEAQRGGFGKESKDKLIKILRRLIDRSKKNIADIKESGVLYSSNRLILYEEAKDMVKKLATEGINLAGKHVEEAIVAQRERDQGRGF